jgi:hypothetical protein
VAEDKGNPLFGAEVSEPVPGEETFDRDDARLALGRHDFEQGLQASFHLAMYHDLAVLVQHADIHGAGV